MPATNKRLSIRTPVIAAIGEVTDRPDRIEEARERVLQARPSIWHVCRADGGPAVLAARLRRGLTCWRGRGQSPRSRNGQSC